MAVDKNFELRKETNKDFIWFSPLVNPEVTIYGFPFLKLENSFNRIPSILNKNLPVNIVSLSKNTSGGQLHFYTNSSQLLIDVELISENILSGMSITAQGGFDIYVGSNYDDLKFYDASRFKITDTSYTYTFDLHNNGLEKLVVLNFPLYNGIKSLDIAIDKGSNIKKASFPKEGRIVIYGTSITQGGCASRPGLAYTNILSRRLKQEVINFGFSGNAFGEREVAEVVSSVEDVKLFILDYEANAGTNGLLYKTLEDFIKIIRSKYPLAPIIVLSRIKYLFDELNPSLGKIREEIRVFQENLVERLTLEGDSNLYYLDGSKIYPSGYDEYTVDGIHPNDLGFMKIADYLEEAIQKILK